LDCTANNSLLEAMACGLPVVTNQIKGLNDYLPANDVIQIANADAEEMAKAVIELFNRKINNSEAIRKHVELNLSWEIISDKYLRFCQKIAANTCS
jgi:glycosyltransferase involved in cell wall biosynthesis